MTKLLKFLGAMEQPVTVLWAVWVVNYEICETNDALMCIRPGMAMKFGFLK